MQVVDQRMAKLKPTGSSAYRRPQAEVLLQVQGTGGPGSKGHTIVARGHLDEVQELKRGGTKLTTAGEVTRVHAQEC